MCRLVMLSSIITCCMGLPMKSVENLEGPMTKSQDASVDQYPYQVSIEYYGSHLCGGAIIGPEWVVTAAHCLSRVIPQEIQVRAGTTTRGFRGAVHKANKIISHPNHFSNSTDNDFDISLIKVSTPFVFNNQIQPVSMTTEEPVAGEMGMVTGWGATSEEGPLFSVLQSMAVPIFDREVCDEDYLLYGGMTENQFCAGIEGIDACLGDSGNPLVVEGEMAGFLIWGIGCDVPGHPGVYANVATLRDFVTNITGIE